MKKLIIILFCLASLYTVAQISYVNTTQPHTNTTVLTGDLRITGVSTNPVSLVNSNNIYYGDPLNLAFSTLNADILYLWNYVQTNSGSGGAGGTNFVAILNGSAFNLTVTNPLSIVSPLQVYSATTITTSGSSNSCENSTWLLDTNLTDVTWGTLTDSCGYVFIPFAFNTNGTVDGLVTNFSNDLTNAFSYSFWFTNQVVANYTADVTNAGSSSVNGHYVCVAPTALASAVASGAAVLTNSANGMQLGGQFGTGCTGGNTIGVGILLSGMFGYNAYDVPNSLWPIYNTLQGFSWPTFFAFPGSCATIGSAPAPSIQFHYSVTNGMVEHFIVFNMQDILPGTAYTTNYTTNAVFSASYDWVILEPNGNGSYTVVSANPYGSFRWIQSAFTTNICTVCPVAPFYSSGLVGQLPNYFQQEAGACWSTAVGTFTNAPCPGCIPLYQAIDVPATNSDRIVSASFTTNQPGVVITSDIYSELQANGKKVALQHSVDVIKASFIIDVALLNSQIGVINLTLINLNWNWITNPPPIPTTNNLVSTNMLFAYNYWQIGSNGGSLRPLFVTNDWNLTTISNFTLSGAGDGGANQEYTNNPAFSNFLETNNGTVASVWSQYNGIANANYVQHNGDTFVPNTYWRAIISGNSEYANTSAFISANGWTNGWQTDIFLGGTAPAPVAAMGITTNQAAATNIVVSWKTADNWMIRLGGAASLTIILTNQLAAAAAFAEEIHRLTLVNDGSNNVALNFYPQPISWLGNNPVTNIFPNQIYRMNAEYLNPGFKPVPAFFLNYWTDTNAILALNF
jgi:hypothetical protein